MITGVTAVAVPVSSQEIERRHCKTSLGLTADASMMKSLSDADRLFIVVADVVTRSLPTVVPLPTTNASKSTVQEALATVVSIFVRMRNWIVWPSS